MSQRELTASHKQTAGTASPAPVPPPPEATGHQGHQVVAGDIPPEAPGYRPRPALLAGLDRAGTRVAVLHAATGLSGVGTTQLAAAYARQKLAADWRLVAWVNAADTSSLQAGLAAVADAAGLTDGGSGRGIADAGQAVRHLLETDGDRCLLVFNDVTDVAALQPFIPARGKAQVLIASRKPADLSPANADLAAASLATVPVEVFGADEALSFLTERTGLDDAAGAAAVAGVLGHLPLPLALAVPAIRGQRHGYSTYLGRLHTIPAAVFLTTDDGQPYPQGVARAVLLSLAATRAADKTGMCTRVIEIMSVLSAAGARRELLHVAGRAGVLAGGGHRVEAVVVDRVLDWLADRSLLSFSADGETVIMHRLVAQVVRDGLARRWRLGAVCFVAASVLEGHAIAVAGSRNRPAVRGIPQQVASLLQITAELTGERDKELAELLLRLRFIALYHLIELGDSAPQAIEVGEALTADLERQLGPGHPDTLNSRNSLAAAYLAAGRVADAIPLFERTLGILQRQLGADHPDTLTSLNNLASAYQDAGRLIEATPLFEQTLAVREQLLGADHASTLNSRGNLAAAYLAAGRVAEAITLFEQTLADRERVLGADHPDTLNTRKNLATAYRDGGQATQAIPLEQTLVGRRPALRPEHSEAQTAAENLVTAYRDTGRIAKPDQTLAPDQTLEPDQTLAPDQTAEPDQTLEPDQTPELAELDSPDDDATQIMPVFLRRPPTDAARRVLPASFRRPPADVAGRLPSEHAAGPPAELPSRSVPSWTHEPPPPDGEHDRQVVAAITAGNPAGLALAYDKYAAALYGYSYWLLHDPAEAGESLQDTFVLAAATLSDLREPSKLRPWLFALARNECRHRVRPSSVTRDEADAADQQADGEQRTDEVGRPEDATTQFVAVGGPADDLDEDATRAFYVVSQLSDATMNFPAFREPSDATINFAAYREPSDATINFAAFRDLDEKPDGKQDGKRDGKPDGKRTGKRGGKREPVDESADATTTFAVFRDQDDDQDDEPDATTTFAKISDLPDLPDDATRPFYMVSQLSDVTMQFRAVGGEPAADAVTDDVADIGGYLGQAELRTLIRSALADLKPREREVIELNVRHDLDDDELALVLGVSPSRAHALAERARARLEKSFGALRTALAGREACPVVGELLADWDGELTEQTRDLVAWHIEQCQTCANHGRGALRPAALSSLLPLAPLPPELREQILARCSATDEVAAAYRRRVVRRAKSTWLALFSQTARRLSWEGIRANPGAAVATTAVAVWLAAAVVVTLLTFAGSHDAHAAVLQPTAGISTSRSVAPSPTDRAPVTPSPSPTVRRTATRPRPVIYHSPTPTYSPSPSYSPTTSPSTTASPSPTTSASKSPSPSTSPSPKPSKSPSPKPSSSPTATS